LSFANVDDKLKHVGHLVDLYDLGAGDLRQRSQRAASCLFVDPPHLAYAPEIAHHRSFMFAIMPHIRQVSGNL